MGLCCREREGIAYSFCASMMTRTLSLVDAVDGGTPMSSRKLLAMVAEAVFDVQV